MRVRLTQGCKIWIKNMRAALLTRGLVLVVFGIVGMSWLASAETLLMPRELVEFARQNRCEQIDDFFDRTATVDPPYAYGYLPGPAMSSAVMWCQTRENGKRQFFLLVMLKNETQQAYEGSKCPRRVEWLEGYPGGLRIYPGAEFLEKFVHLRQPQKPGPKDVRMNGNAIWSEYGGTGSVLYCYQGQWLVKQWD